MQEQMMETQRIEIVTTLELVDKLRLKIADQCIMGRSRYDQKGLSTSLLEETIKAVRKVDIKVDDFNLTRSLSCVIAETGFLFENDHDLRRRRADIDLAYIYSNLYKISLALNAILDPDYPDKQQDNRRPQACV